MSYNITGTTITLTRGDTFEALVSATKRDGTQYIPVAGDILDTLSGATDEEVTAMCTEVFGA